MRILARISPLAAAVGLVTASCADTDRPVLIGLAGPFSDPRGVSMQRAAELAVAEINERGGAGGRPLELVIHDDSTDAAAAVRAARQLYANDGIVAVIGHLTSATTLAAAPVYNGGATPLPVISPSASSPQVTQAGPYTFRTCPDDLVHGRRLAEWARRRLGARTAAVIYHNDDYGRGVRATFTTAFTRLEGAIAASDPYVPAIPTFEPFLRRIALRGGVDLVMIAGARSGAERIIPTLDSVGINPIVMGGDGLAGIEGADVDAEGVYVSTAYLADRPGERNRQFVAAYRRAYDDQLPDHRGAGAYDIVYLLARAIDEVGPNREALQYYLAGVGTRSPAFEGVTGTVAFDVNGDVPDKDVVIGIVRGGRLVTAAR